ncbi:MAG TPA: tetratricopeptide repeat protein [Casimicrobiaceae bacterium]
MHAEDDIAPTVLAEELDRICASLAFRHSHRHQRFLRHLIDCKLHHRLSALREVALGVEFFRRPPGSYDPKVDAVVRVEAGRLRRRLDRYYHGEGTAAPFEVILDRGSYLPSLRRRTVPAIATGAQPSVAVLPVPPSTSQPADAGAAVTLTDEIVRTLSRLPQIRVFGPESSLAAGVATDAGEARDRWNVTWIVRGTWSRDEPRDLVLEIAGTAAEEPAIVKTIEALPDDPPTFHQRVRDELLHGFAAILGIVGESGAPHGPVPATRDLAAFDLYQRARYLLKQRDPYLLPRAIEQLAAAVRIDPDFSAAWAELAEAHVRRRRLVFDPGERDPAAARRAARRAIELDPHCAGAYATLAGLAYAADFDWSRAGDLFTQALIQAPRDLGVRSAYAAFLMYSARFEEALREYDVIQALDPLDPATRCHKGALHFYWRHYERAETLLTQSLELAPNDVYAQLLLADTFAQAGRPDESLEASRRLVEIAPDYANSQVYVARALRMLGREQEAASIMHSARARFGGHISEYEEAMLHVAGNECASALECLERHALRKANGAHCIAVDPTFVRLHADPRWPELLTRCGLPDFSARLAAACAASGPV